MERIATATRAVDLHGAGKDGFTAGNAQGGTPPTQLSADFCNAVQEELCTVIEEGGITLDGADNTQLLQGIKLVARDWTPDGLSEFGKPVTIRTQQFNDERDEWVNSRKVANALNVASGTTGEVAVTVPHETYFAGIMTCIVCRTDEPSSHAVYVRAFGGRCTAAGIATINNDAAILTAVGSLAIDSVTFNYADDLIKFQVAFNASPADKKYNIAVTWELQLVTPYEA